MTITPEQAQEWLDGATPGPWAHDEVPGPGEDPTRATEVYPKDEYGVIAYVQPNAADVELIAAAPDMAETIAGMEYDYGIQQPRPEPHMAGHLMTSWGYRLSAAKATYAGLTDHGVECHIVRRLVSSPEVIDGE